QAHCSGDEIRIFSRTRDDITESFPELPDALAGLPLDAILDGEIVAWSYLTEVASASRRLSRGLPTHESRGRDLPVTAAEDGGATMGAALPFSALQQRLGRKKVSEELQRRVPVAFLVFDVLYAGGDLLIDLPLHARAKILDELLAERKPAKAR